MECWNWCRPAVLPYSVVDLLEIVDRQEEEKEEEEKDEDEFDFDDFSGSDGE